MVFEIKVLVHKNFGNLNVLKIKVGLVNKKTLWRQRYTNKNEFLLKYEVTKDENLLKDWFSGVKRIISVEQRFYFWNIMVFKSDMIVCFMLFNFYSILLKKYGVKI